MRKNNDIGSCSSHFQKYREKKEFAAFFMKIQEKTGGKSE